MGAEQTQTPTKVENKITFGLENVHWSKVTTQPTGEIQYSKPEKLAGAVELELNPISTDIKLKADNIDYHVSESNDGYTGKVTFYNTTEAFDEYVNGLEKKGELTVEKSTAQSNPIALLFQMEGDKHATRFCLPQVSVKRPKFGTKTKDGANVNTVELEFTASPRPTDKVVRYKTNVTTSDEVYNKFFDEIKQLN
jgi:phage major tail protein, phi13 family|nr:MAG TPA: tail tube protein [Caudoviricetes sp.]